ncbi:MAG: MFS transporter [Gammaproteobacteria bacterium]
MLRTVTSISSLLLGTGILLVGVGLLGTLLGVRAGVEGFSGTVTGLVMSAYFVGYVVGTAFCPALIRRVGHIRAYAAMAAVASSAALAHALVVDPLAWGALRGVTGACLVGLYMVVETWLNAAAPSQRRGQVFAIYMTISLLALALGQFLLLAGSVTSFVPFALVAMLVSLGLVPVALTRVAEPPLMESARLHLRELYRISPTGLAGAFGAGLVIGAFWGMGALFGHDMELSQRGIALFMSSTIVGGAVLQFPIGHFSDGHDRRTVLMAVSMATALLAAVMFAVVPLARWALYTSAFVFGGFAFTVYSLSVAHLNDHLDAAHLIEASRGLLLVYGVGSALGPLAAGWLMEALGPRSLPAYFALVMALLGLFTLARMRHAPPVPAEEQAEFVPMVRTTPAVLEMDPRAEVEPELDLE